MLQNVFCDNLKRFRLAKNLTQEQVAAALGINSQTVSRWECGTTLPDVLTLPALAVLYGVAVDDFYKKKPKGYDNYAQRLAAVFEDSHDFGDFICAREEYLKLMKDSELSITDMWTFGWLHACMSELCKDAAIEWYGRAVETDPAVDRHAHHLACMRRIEFYSRLNKNDEITDECRRKAEEDPDNAVLADYLVVCLIAAKKYENAYNAFIAAKEKFPDYWCLFIHGGEICAETQRYAEAEQYFRTAGELGTAFCDDLYGLASLSERQGDYKKAAAYYMQIAQIMKNRGCDVEQQHAVKMAQECRGKTD